MGAPRNVGVDVLTGAPDGTVRVRDIDPGAGHSSPEDLTNVNGTLFFQAYDGTSGEELWKSDGTEGGTVMVADIWPGSGDSDVEYLTNVNGTLFFTAEDDTSGTELWALSLTGNGDGVADVDGDGVPDGFDHCPGTPAGEEVNANGCSCSQLDCDDDIPCTVDTCVAGECVHAPMACPAGQVCDPDAGVCVSCLTNEECDDDDPCTVDTCVDGACDNDAVACSAGQFCDPDTGECVDCLTEDECDDDDLCTIDTCVDGECKRAPVECPVGQSCDADTGDCAERPAGQCSPALCNDDDPCTIEECVDTDGDGGEECVNTPTECLDTQSCDPDTGECVDCLTDEECEDDDPCTVDMCASGECVSPPVECPVGQTCDPDTGDCVTSGAAVGGGRRSSRGSCGLFNLPGLIVLPASILAWTGIRRREGNRAN